MIADVATRGQGESGGRTDSPGPDGPPERRIWHGICAP